MILRTFPHNPRVTGKAATVQRHRYLEDKFAIVMPLAVFHGKLYLLIYLFYTGVYYACSANS